MSRGKKSDFERVEGEGILRVRNENEAKMWKISNKKQGMSKVQWSGRGEQ